MAGFKHQQSGVRPLRIRRKRAASVRSSGQRGEYDLYELTVPKIIAMNLPDDARFMAELTPTGDLLYRRVA